jgi:hypothetical protein
MIDDIYKKERLYVSSVDRDNTFTPREPIFQLERYRNLKTHTGVEKTARDQVNISKID